MVGSKGCGVGLTTDSWQPHDKVANDGDDDDDGAGTMTMQATQ